MPISDAEIEQLAKMHGTDAIGGNQEKILAFLRKETTGRKKENQPIWFTIEEIRKGAKIGRHESTFSSLQSLVKKDKVEEAKKVIRGQNVYRLK